MEKLTWTRLSNSTTPMPTIDNDTKCVLSNVSGSACLHDFVIKFGEYECQNCGILHEDIFNPKNIVANLVKDNKSCDKPCSPSDWCELPTA